MRIALVYIAVVLAALVAVGSFHAVDPAHTRALENVQKVLDNQ